MLGEFKTDQYAVSLVTRGGLSKIGQLDPTIITGITWERKQDDPSAATIDLGLSPGCPSCDMIANIDPLITELVIFRNRTPVWTGPITLVEFDRNIATIDALDVSAILDWRILNKDFSSKGAPRELVTQAYEMFRNALDPDPAGVKVEYFPGDIVGERETLASDHRVAQDEISELLRTNVDLVVTGRTVRLYGTEVQKVFLPDFTEQDFLDNVRVRRDGLKVATVVHVNGGGSLWSVYPVENKSKYGIKERVFNEPSILDQFSLDQAAKTRWELLNKPVLEIEVPRGARLSPEAKIDINDLVPGRRQKIILRDMCVPVSGTFRLADVKVVVSPSGERVSCSWQPLGSVI